MKSSKALRIAVTLEIALIPVGAALSLWAEQRLPEEALALELNQPSFVNEMESLNAIAIGLFSSAVVLLAVYIVAIIGLLKLRRWGAWTYLIGFLFLPVVFFLFGFDFRHPIEQVFEIFYYSLPGLIIGLAFFSDAIPKIRSEQGADAKPDNVAS